MSQSYEQLVPQFYRALHEVMEIVLTHIRAVESPLPVANLEDDEGEKEVARIASPWPGISDAQRPTARTRKTACGVYCRLMESSVDLRPGLRREWYRSLEISRALFVFEGSNVSDR